MSSSGIKTCIGLSARLKRIVVLFWTPFRPPIEFYQMFRWIIRINIFCFFNSLLCWVIRNSWVFRQISWRHQKRWTLITYRFEFQLTFYIQKHWKVLMETPKITNSKFVSPLTKKYTNKKTNWKYIRRVVCLQAIYAWSITVEWQVGLPVAWPKINI